MRAIKIFWSFFIFPDDVPFIGAKREKKDVTYINPIVYKYMHKECIYISIYII